MPNAFPFSRTKPMARIQQLPTTLINQIAAGEVVERPASVVKELLENAVDAGSQRIDVEVAQGGIDLIRVVDDGGGIAEEDLPLAFASHATSKLGTVEDLFRIGTLGFRGEALASIGSIAQVTLQSRPPERPFGAEISCQGGQLSSVRAWNGSPGTRIEVRHLFYNTPARRKFLKGVGTEVGHVSEVFIRLALARLGLHFTLRHNNRLVYEVPGTMGLLDRLGLFFGAEVANSLYMVQAEQGPITLAGYIGDPACERGHSQLQYLFLNGRWVRDRGLFQAVQDAYRGLLMTGRYPVAFLFLELPPEQVDVNVHPTKAEVRFRDREVLYQLVHQAIRDRLQAADLTARMQLRPRKEQESAPLSNPRSPLRAAKPVPLAPNREKLPPSLGPKEMPAAARSTVAAPSVQNLSSSPDALPATARTPPSVAPADLFSPGQEKEPGAQVPGQQAADIRPTLPRIDRSLKALQVLDCYLVVEVPPDEVLFIDQHALHERSLFEQLQQRLRTGTLESQRLLIPEPITLPPAQAALVLEHRAALSELGLGVEDFGGGTVLLSSYPTLLSRQSPKEVFQAVVDHLVKRERAPSPEQLLNDLLSLLACHAAVRAGDRLTPEEIAALVAQRDLAQDSHHCPHGRPTSLRFSRHDLDRHFRRV
jgi:DNA mismatch repair protein MutL